MTVPYAKRLTELATQNGRLKKRLAERMLGNEVVKNGLRKVVSAPARRELVRHMIGKGFSDRCSLAIAGVGASAYRSATRLDRNVELRQRILTLAQRHCKSIG